MQKEVKKKFRVAKLIPEKIDFKINTVIKTKKGIT